MAFSPDNVKGILGKFKPVLDKLFTRTQNNIQGVLGKFKFVLDETSIVAPDPPTVTTQAVSLPNTGNGNITNTGGENNDKRGFAFGKTSKPDPGTASPASSGYDDFVEDSGNFGTGAFTKALTPLAIGTIYFIRAYGHNSAGYGYGGEQTFTTQAAKEKGVTVLQSVPDKAIPQLKTKARSILPTTKKDGSVL